MKSKIKRDIIKRKSFKKFESKRRVMKAFSKGSKNKIKTKLYFAMLLRDLTGKKSFVQTHNFCQITYKARSVFRFFGLERSVLRENFLRGSLNYICYKLPL